MRTPTSAPDGILSRSAARGDTAAFEELVRRHSHQTYRLAFRLLGDPQAAEDATQDAFLAAWNALPTFRGDSAFSTWLHRITTNTCLSARRRRRQESPLPDTIESSTPGPDTTAEGRDAMVALRLALSTLTDQQHAVWVLRELEDLSYAEIAVRLDITEASVKSRLNRARGRLVIAMQGYR